jgi:hypothetical protein
VDGTVGADRTDRDGGQTRMTDPSRNRTEEVGGGNESAEKTRRDLKGTRPGEGGERRVGVGDVRRRTSRLTKRVLLLKQGWCRLCRNRDD